MSDPVFGISITRVDDEPRPAIGSDLSVIGVIGVDEDADTDAFPLDTPVQLYSDDVTMTGKLGPSAIRDAIEGANDQLGEFQVAARVVVVRVATGGSDAETMAAIAGDSLTQTGLWAFTKAGQDLGVIPRIILAPGWTHQYVAGAGERTVTRADKPGGNTGNGTMTLSTPAYGTGIVAGVYRVRCIGGARSANATANPANTGNGTMGSLTADATAAIGTWTVACTNAQSDGGVFTVMKPDGTLDGVAVVGAAYNGGINFTIADGATDFIVGDEFEVAVAATVPSNGGVFSVRRPDGTYLADATLGVAYSNQIRFTIADGATDFAIGDGFDVTVSAAADAEANPVVAEMPAVLNKLLGVAIVSGPSDTYQNWLDWRETIQSERIIPLASGVKVGSPATTKDAAGRIAGIFVRRDHEKGGLPFWSSANQPVQGIVAPSRSIPFSLTDAATEGQQFLAANGGVIVRGQMGVEQAIAAGGFVYVGTDTCSEDTLWTFYNVVRGRDYIHLMFLRTLRYYLGRYNIHGHTITAILNTMKIALADLQAREAILGYKVGFARDLNSPEQIRLGRFTVSFAAEEAPVLRHLGIQSARYRPALDALLDDLTTQLATIA